MACMHVCPISANIICISASTADHELTDSTVFVPASHKAPASVGTAGDAAPKAVLG